MNPSNEKVKESLKAFQNLDSILESVVNPKKKEKPVSEMVSPNSFTAKDVELPEDFILGIVGKTKPINEMEEVSEEEETPEVIQESAEVRITKLVSQLKALLEEARSVMTEVTTTGMIGTNQKFALGKKNGPVKTNKRNKGNGR